MKLEGEQITLFQNKKKQENPAVCCQHCRFCAELKRPYERSDGATIYGYCFKDGEKDYSLNMGKGYPIFLKLTSGASCKAFKRRKGGERD